MGKLQDVTQKALINEYDNLSSTGNKLNMITESKKTESDNDEEHKILIRFWETKEDRDLGESDIYDYYDISSLKDVIKIAKDLQYDWDYASIEVQDAKTGETYYFTDGEEEEYFGIAKDLKESKKVEDYSYYWKDDIEEVENTEENDELVYNVAEHMKETQPEEYAEEDVWDIASNIINLWKIAKRSRLYDYLIKWYGSEQEMLNKVRDVYETRDAIYFVTGSGYSLFDADLLGGNADGRTQDAFSKFVANGGKKVENVEVESKKVETYSYYWKDDIDEIEDDDIWYDVAENMKNTDPDYADWDVIEILSDIICVWGIQKRTRLYDYLLKWYGSEEELLKNVRDVLDTNDAIYFVTGIGYSIWSADLLGGTADGLAERDFTRFVDNGGKKEDTKEN